MGCGDCHSNEHVLALLERLRCDYWTSLALEGRSGTSYPHPDPSKALFEAMLTVGGHCSYRTWIRCWQRSFLSLWISAAAPGQTSLQEKTEWENLGPSEHTVGKVMSWSHLGVQMVEKPAWTCFAPQRILVCHSITDYMNPLTWLVMINYWKDFRILTQELFKPSSVERALSNLLPKSHLFLERGGSGTMHIIYSQSRRLSPLISLWT